MLQQDSGLIVGKLLGGDPRYKLSAVYVEFQNLADPDDPVTPPSPVPADEGIDYYQDLSGSVDRDFVRVPVSFPPFVDTDDTLYDKPNRMTIVVQVPEGTGFHGRTFNSSANSKVYGLAVVATPTWSDPGQDLIYERTYYAADDQAVIGPSGVLTLTYRTTFPVT